MSQHRLAFCASTGRTATLFVATTLGELPGVTALHEGHTPGNPPVPRLPRINLQNRKAWHDPDFARQLVAELRNDETMSAAASAAKLVIDVAFYNAPLLVPLNAEHPDARLLVMFRRCEGFVRSATIVTDEDLQPAGWPDRNKPLTDREQFIALGRLRPQAGSPAAERWNGWSAIQRNTWLWHSVNAHLLDVADSTPACQVLLFEDLVDRPERFWKTCLHALQLDTDANLAQCVQRSARRINQRPSYQVGPASTWSGEEQALYDELATPLEQRIYA